MNINNKIYFVTGNPNKFKEANQILSKHHIQLEMINSKKKEIQNNDIAVIAKTSLKETQKRVSGPVIVEDSGLYISSLHGFPGPYSAYVYETLGCDGILNLLRDQVSRDAEFRSVIAYTENKKTSNIKIFLGITKGKISEKICGTQGFGFDPIFLPLQIDKTFGEIDLTEKNKYSHRAIAINNFASWYLINK